MSDPAASAATNAAAPATADTVETWFRESFHGTVLAQNTEHFNLVRRAVDDLKKRLAPPTPPA